MWAPCIAFELDVLRLGDYAAPLVVDLVTQVKRDHDFLVFTKLPTELQGPVRRWFSMYEFPDGYACFGNSPAATPASVVGQIAAAGWRPVLAVISNPGYAPAFQADGVPAVLATWEHGGGGDRSGSWLTTAASHIEVKASTSA